MDYAQRQKASIKTEFAQRRRNQLLVSIPLVGVVFLLIFFGETPNQMILGMPVTMWGPAFVALIVGGVAFSLYNWRCPACHKYLGKSISPKFCVKCGAELS